MLSSAAGPKPLPNAEEEAKDVYFRCAPTWEHFLAPQVLHYCDYLILYQDRKVYAAPGGGRNLSLKREGLLDWFAENMYTHDIASS